MQSECDNYRHQIAKSLYGELSADELRTLEEHIASCSQCQSEKESYTRTLSMMQSADDEPVPRHFLIRPEEKALSPWELFRLLKWRWQAITAVFAGLLLLAGFGGVLGFSRGHIDVAALKEDFLQAAGEQNRRTAENTIQEVRAEIARSNADLTQQQKTELAAALDRMESRITGGLKQTENRMWDDSQKMAADLYRSVSQQRAQDLALINLRFDVIEASSTIESRQTDAILNTLFQVAEIGFK